MDHHDHHMHEAAAAAAAARDAGGHEGHDHGAMDDGCASHHAMVFHAGVCQEILFPGWKTRTAWELAGSALAILLAGVLYEGLKYYREALHARATAAAAATDSRVNITKTECGANGSCGNTAIVKYGMASRAHATQTLLHVVQSVASYALMLVFMTYNVWLCMALVAGLGLGYFAFGWRKNTVVDLTEHCQ